jgi:hypothetical protein
MFTVIKENDGKDIPGRAVQNIKNSRITPSIVTDPKYPHVIILEGLIHGDEITKFFPQGGVSAEFIEKKEDLPF